MNHLQEQKGLFLGTFSQMQTLPADVLEVSQTWNLTGFSLMSDTNPSTGPDEFDVLEELDLGCLRDGLSEVLHLNLPRRSRSRNRSSRQSGRAAASTEEASTAEACLSVATGEKLSLDLSRRDVSNEQLSAVIAPALISESCRLTTLVLTRNRLGDSGAMVLAEVLQGATNGTARNFLTRLDVNQNEIGEAGATALLRALQCGSSGPHRLVHLDVAWNGDIELETKLSIAASLIQNVEVTSRQNGGAPGSLFFAGQALGDCGVAALSRLLQGTTAINSVNLSDCDIREGGGRELVQLLTSNSSLTALDLDENYELPLQLREECASMLVRNRSLPGLLLQRYRQDSGPPLHHSSTSLVVAAEDVKCSTVFSPKRVAIKFMRHAHHLRQELDARLTLLAHASDGVIENPVAVPVIGFHVPAEEFDDWGSRSSASSHHMNLTRPQAEPFFVASPVSADFHAHPYVLVMALGGRSLHEACSRERLAGRDPHRVRTVLLGLAHSLEGLHRRELVHGDVKPRNVLALSMPTAAPSTQATPDVQRKDSSSSDRSSVDCSSVDLEAPDFGETSFRGTFNESNIEQVKMEETWLVCDLEASVPVGLPIGGRSSTAYAPPELSRALALASSGPRAAQDTGISDAGSETCDGTLAASTSFDMWGLGAVMFELCSGRTLLPQDTGDDCLVSSEDWARLCCWHTMHDNELACIFERVCNEVNDAVIDARVEEARHLIRWCLQGNPAHRPSIVEFISHPFFRDDKLPRISPLAFHPVLSMRYHFFISHCQADASGVARALYDGLNRRGCSCWLDMEEDDLTLEGMRAGVRASDCLIAVLSAHYAGSWFCQQEILEAVRNDVKIVAVVEKENRFHPFQLSDWCASAADPLRGPFARPESSGGNLGIPPPDLPTLKSGERLSPKAGGAGFAAVPMAVCSAIDAALVDSIPFRRRDFEVDAMLREVLFRFACIPLPPPGRLPPLPGESSGAPLAAPNIDESCCTTSMRALEVHVIHEQTTGDPIVKALQSVVAGSPDLDFRVGLNEIDFAEKILVVLTPGVLRYNPSIHTEESSSLKVLEKCLRADHAAGTDRLVFIYDSDAGWAFGCPEHRGAPTIVADALNDHEALTWRTPDPSGPSRHEFPALLQKLRRRFGLR